MCVKLQKRQPLIKADQWFPGAGQGRGLSPKTYEGTYQGNGNVLNINCGVVTRLYVFVRTLDCGLDCV